MGRVLTTISVVLLLAGCRAVSQDEPAHGPADNLRTPAFDFSEADSLMLSGEFSGARDLLLTMLSDTTAPESEVLLRLTGLHSGRAMEDAFVSLMDSLESCRSVSLDGWKVSALVLAGRPLDALDYSMDDTLLTAWLLFTADSAFVPPDVPVFRSGGVETAVRTIITPAGELPADGRIYGLSGLPQMPRLIQRLTLELESTADSAGDWWMAALDSLRPAIGEESFTLLTARRMASLDQGEAGYWLSIAAGKGEAAVIAARELMDRFPGALAPTWKLVDLLAESGETDLALEVSFSGDAFHRLGAEMAILHSRGHYGSLGDLCDSVDPGMPDSLRARAALYGARALRGGSAGGHLVYPAFLSFSGNHPWHPQARREAYNAGKYHDCEQEWSAAAEAYLASLNSAGVFEGDERAHWRCGFSMYMSGDLTGADSIWAAGIAAWPFGYWRDEMLFWRARLAGETGNGMLGDSLLGVAVREHPWEFYGMLASRRTGGWGAGRFEVPQVRFTGMPSCSLAMELLSMGYGTLAVDLLVDGDDPVPHRSVMLSLLGRNGEALHLLRALDVSLRESSGSILPDSLLCFYFPAPYLDLAESATADLDLSAWMLQGIMREESYFNRWVVSRAGARGVIQLMPATASDVARWYDLPPLEDEQFFDPVASVPYGALYIDRQRSAFDGAEALFLAAYNAGPGNSTRWVDMHGWNSSDPELYIEQVTYRETRMYMKKVLRSAWIYEGYGAP